MNNHLLNYIHNTEKFIVDIEDSITLFSLYLNRLKKDSSKIGIYSDSICQYSEELVQATESLQHSVTSDTQIIPTHILEIIKDIKPLSELLQYSALRLATQQIKNIPGLIDTLISGTEYFTELVKQLSSKENINNTNQTNLIIADIRALLNDGSISSIANLQTNTLTLNNSDLFTATDDPFDELTLDDAFFDDVINKLDRTLVEFIEPTITTTQNLDTEIIKVPESAPATEFALETPHRELQDLFANIAAAYIKPLKEFITTLRNGKTSKEWLEICRPSIQSIIRASSSMEYIELKNLLDSFDQLLLQIQQQTSGQFIEPIWQTKLLQTYAELEEFLPQTFQISNNLVSTEGIIISSLLKQVKGVGQGTIKKLFSTGLTSLNLYFIASAQDISATTGIKSWLAERICEKFKLYKQEVDQLSYTRNQLEKNIQTLVALVEELKRQQFLFKKATLDTWYKNTDAIYKKRCRNERQQVMWRINIVLAQLGEIELIQKIKDFVFEKRIWYLQDFLNSKLVKKH